MMQMQDSVKTSVIRVPRRWAAFIHRIMSLKPERRYQIVITIRTDSADWSIADVGAVEAPDY